MLAVYSVYEENNRFYTILSWKLFFETTLLIIKEVVSIQYPTICPNVKPKSLVLGTKTFVSVCAILLNLYNNIFNTLSGSFAEKLYFRSFQQCTQGTSDQWILGF